MGNFENVDLSRLSETMMGNGIQKDKNVSKNSGNKKEVKQSKNNNNFKPYEYVGAPYNFISLTDQVYHYPRGIQWHHNDISEDLFTGELIYEITAQTPIMVDGGDGFFFKTANGRYAIPGSTIRGLIRNNAQILGLSSVEKDIDDYALMYRSIASGSKDEKNRYSKILGVNNNNVDTRGIAVNVKAGYVTLENGAYYIDVVSETFDKEANYLMLSSKRILSERDNFPFFTSNWKRRMMYNKNCVFERTEKINGIYNNKNVRFFYKTEDSEEVERCIVNKKISFKKLKEVRRKGKPVIVISSIGKPGCFNEEGEIKYNKNKDGAIIDRTISYDPTDKNTMVNKYYEPYYEPVYFELDESDKKIKSVYPRDSDVNSLPPAVREGYVLSSGWLDGKKNLYIIPEVSCGTHTIKIDSKDIKAFSADLNKRIKTLSRYFGQEQNKKEIKEEKARAFYGLPKKEGERKPIFFIESEGRLYFGFTPRLRLFYDYTIKDGFKGDLKSGAIDYNMAIFGYSQGKESYKSKVSFLDAVIQSKQEQEPSKKTLILAEPKPTSYWDYLDQNIDESSEPVTYNNSEMRLRGIKQYWLHKETDLPGRPVEEKKDNEKKTNGPESTFYPLGKNITFIGKVRFWNMTEDELGLLLWSIQLDSGKSWMNVGKAKPYGYGSISLKLISAKRLDMQNAYSLERLDLNPVNKDINVEQAIQKYKDHINDFLKKKKIDDLPSVKEFFAMKDSTKIPNADSIKYMSIDNGDYQNRKKPLQNINEVIKEQLVSEKQPEKQTAFK